MVPMAANSVWLLLAGGPLYEPYRLGLGQAEALHDQRLAGLIMLLAAVPALAVALAAPGKHRRPDKVPYGGGSSKRRHRFDVPAT
jgi:cytochrome c oxidase assembly factor CtaG